MSMVVLSPEQAHRLRSVLQELDPAAPREKRVWPRHKVAMDMWIRTIGGEHSSGVYRVMAINLSKRGVGLMSKRLMSVGERFALPLRFEDGGGKLVLCQVRNARRLEGGHCKVGASFISWIEDPEGTARIPAEWNRRT